jgi:hypothetical protein
VEFHEYDTGFMKSHTIAAAGLESGRSNHQKTVPFWRSFI